MTCCLNLLSTWTCLCGGSRLQDCIYVRTRAHFSRQIALAHVFARQTALSLPIRTHTTGRLHCLCPYSCLFFHVCVKMKPKPRLENCCVPNCNNRTARVFKFPRDQGLYFISSKTRKSAQILRHKVKEKKKEHKTKLKCVKYAMNDNFFLHELIKDNDSS